MNGKKLTASNDRRKRPRGALVPELLALRRTETMLVPARHWPGVASAASRWGKRLGRRWKGRRIVTEQGVLGLYLIERVA